MENLNQFPVIASFAAGILTFVSPCVLPLIPAYISFITGASIDDLKAEKTPLLRTFWNAVFFITGFSLVFILLGASASYLGSYLIEGKNYLRYIGGIIVIIFGIHTTGFFKIKFFYIEKRVQLGKMDISYLSSFFTGIAFAAGWTPCIGPILSSILILASAQATIYKGILLLTLYSLGLGIPFLLTALFINMALGIFAKIRHFYRAIEIVSGLILILVGFLIVTDSFKILTKFLSKFIQ